MLLRDAEGAELRGPHGEVQQGRVYYICSARYPKDKPWSCDGKKIIGRESEDWIWKHVKNLLSNPEVLKEQ
ncbi:MAG TPA: hypothetical protein VJB14_01950 [Planctomycetota bacterium]|nr:hypothetical protein [Planctomycetota bacterium]